MSARSPARWLGLVMLGLAAWQLAAALHIPAKAWVAQVLLARAWETTRTSGEPVRPWRGADTWPVARLDFPRIGAATLVLSGASGRNLAFGPVVIEVPARSGPGLVVAGHRDTHFRVLRELRAGDHVRLEQPGHRARFVVTTATSMHADMAARVAADADGELVLVTCFPFDAVIPGTPWRYVVRATPLAAG